MNASHVLLAAGWMATALVPITTSAQAGTGTRPPAARTPTTTPKADTTRKTTRPTATRVSRATSQRRIPVQKTESAAGTLERTRADSIAMAERIRRDSLDAVMRWRMDSTRMAERYRADSIEAAAAAALEAESLARMRRAEEARRDSLARLDSIAAAEDARQRDLARYRFGGQGWYMAFGGGAVIPTTDFDQIGYRSGFNVNLPIGWHPQGNVFGVRLDLVYNQFAGQNYAPPTADGSPILLDNPNPQVFSGTMNLTVDLPIHPLRNLGFYGLGGGGVYHFQGYGTTSALGGFLGNEVRNSTEATNKSSRTRFGAQAGLGLDWTVGTSSLYVESRFVTVWADRSNNARFREVFGQGRNDYLQWVPIVLGVKVR